jgi:20S proteasome alpha/beta subunit
MLLLLHAAAMRLYHFNPFSPLILLLILVVNAAAQFDTGTVIIVGYSHDKIIVVAESRQAGEKGEHFDNGCKITALNDKFFFAASGRAQDITQGVVGWSAHDQAKEILDSTSKESRTATNMAFDWGNKMAKRIDRYIRPEEKAKLTPRNVYLTGLFAGISPTGETEIAKVNVEPVVVNGKEMFGTTIPGDNSVEVPPVADKMNYVVLGREAGLFNELFYATSERAK